MKRLCFEQALAGQNTVFKPGLGFEEGGFDLKNLGILWLSNCWDFFLLLILALLKVQF